MFSNLFASKMEKELQQICPPGTELMLHYRGAESFTVSQMLKIYRESIVLLGFFSKLRSAEITVKCLETGFTFDTEVRRLGSDKNGNAMFYCDMPKAVVRPKSRPIQYLIYPNGSAKVLLSTNRGERSVAMPIWAVTEFGVVLSNESGVEVKIGTKLFQALVQVGAMNGQLCNMQVANIRTENGPNGPLRLLSCVYTAEPRNLSEILTMAKANIAKPKAKGK